jgi:acylphosphatase
VATLALSPVAYHVIVHGRVQGVGYRDAAVQAAFEHGVAGWVRNRAEGTVEILAQGPPEAVERFLQWCRRGPPLARVADVTVAKASVDPMLHAFDWRTTA